MSPLLSQVLLILFAAAITFVATYYWSTKQARQTLATERAAMDLELNRRLAELERQQAVLSQAVIPISAAFQSILIKQLTHFHTPVLDELLKKLGPPITLTEAEEHELQAALEERTRDMGDEISDSERDAARMLPMVMKRVRTAADTEDPVDLRVVSVPKNHE
jgi:hypothetical protein